MSELDVVIEAATEEEEVDVSCLIFSRTLSTFPETSATFSAVDGPSVVSSVDPGVVGVDPSVVEEEGGQVSTIIVVGPSSGVVLCVKIIVSNGEGLEPGVEE